MTRLPLLLLLAACPQKDDPAGDDSAPVVDCDATSFAESAVPWSLPAFTGSGWRDEVPFAEADAVAYRDCGDGDDQALQYHIADYTADGVPDLVVTYDGCSSEGLGRSHWDIYGGTASGFLGTPIPWTLPEFDGTSWGGDAPFAAVGGQTWRSCGGEEQSLFNYAARDMNADGVPDLVVSYDDCDGTTIGTSVWDVYLGGGGGFATDPTPWALPAMNGDTWNVEVPFIDLASGTWRNCNGDHYADIYHSTEDFTGDGWMDLAVTYDTCANPDLSSVYWWIFPGGEGGFAADPVEYTLPTREGEDWSEGVPWSKPTGEVIRTCGGDEGASMSFTTLDVDGDGLLDLAVIEDTCDTTGLSTSHWDVYPGNGAGFATTPVAWTLPTTDGEDWSRGAPFTTLGDRNERTCAGIPDMVLRYQAEDLTGDGALDLVVTVDPCADPDLGLLTWDVYAGSPTGFAATPIAWALPSVDGISWSKDVPFPELTEASDRDCGTNEGADFSYSTFAITGDRNPDLVVTYDACGTDGVGLTNWRVYAGVCG